MPTQLQAGQGFPDLLLPDHTGQTVTLDGGTGIQVVDIADPANPTLLGSTETGNARDVILNGDFAFVADLTSSFTVVDLSDPVNPTVQTSTPRETGGLLEDVTQVDRFAFGADIFFVNGVPIINVENPGTPIPAAILDFGSFRDDNGTGIAADSNFVYLTANTRLYIGQYLSLDDTLGIPPVVSIASISGEPTLVEGETVTVEVEASDDITVVSVDLLVDDTGVATDTNAPYQFEFTVPVGQSSVEIAARAIDLGGNVGITPAIVRDVIPDPLTTVAGVVVDPDATPVECAGVNVAFSESNGPANLFNATTALDGTFAIANVPTIFGDLRVKAVLERPGEPDLQKTSAPLPPVRGGTTDFGVIQLADVPIGHSQDNPAKSCLAILQADAADGDRKYWIEVPSGVFEMHCDFSSDTGGWTRVGALDGTQNYCTTNGFTDMRFDPDASAGKIPDSDALAIMSQTPGSPMDVMYFIRGDNRFVWHALQNIEDFETSSKHTSADFYCANWHCDDGSTDASVCGTEGDGCPVTAHGIRRLHEEDLRGLIVQCA